MTVQKEKIWFFIALVFAVCLTIFTLSYLVIEPGHVISSLSGDGVKNNFTYLYQCVYGKGFWFDGMNYPYGEHIVFADGQPSLSVILSFFHVSAVQALTVMWLLIGLSYVLSVVYIYKTLTHFKVVAPVAIIFAGLITVFSPQVFRIGGHYALSYICVVPMLFYWTIMYNERSLWRYCSCIFVLGCFTSFIHPYFAGLTLLWVSGYIAGYIIFTSRQWRLKIRHIIPILVSLIGVLGFMAIVMRITDPVKDRPGTPLGILDSFINKYDIFTATHSPIWSYIHRHHMLGGIFPDIGDVGEGYTYTGIVVIVTLVFSLIAGIVNKLWKNKAGIIVGDQAFSPVWLFMGFGTLLFIIMVPFAMRVNWLFNCLSVLRQFRALGRFVWIFYYIATIYAVVVIYTHYSQLMIKRRYIAGYSILLLSIGLWSYEASGYIKYTRSVATESPKNYDMLFSVSEQNWESFLQQHHFTKNDFQAILALDFFHIGSEKLWVGDGGGRMTYSAKAAFQLHLPIVDVMMSRTSLSQTEKQVKIAGGLYVDKPILRAISNNKPFLLLKFDSLNQDEQYLLQASDLIGHFSGCDVYAFYPERELANEKRAADSIDKIISFMNAPDTCIEYKGDWYVNHLDKAHAETSLFGGGAEPVIKSEDSTIAVIPVKPLNDNQLYEFSGWFLLNDKDYTYPCAYLESLDSTGSIIANDAMNTKWSVDNYGLWFRGSVYFCLKANCRAVRCRVSNVPNPSYKIMDELMLRPADALIISKDANGRVMVNNHLFKKNGNHE